MVSTQPALDGLPTELLEGVIALLPFQDVCSLRLVSRTIAARSGHGAFRKHFTTKTVNWTSTEQMQGFVHLTQPHWMGCLLQHLIIIGIASAASLEHPSRLLTKAFTNLRLNSAHRGLRSIVLLVKGHDENNNLVPCEKIRDWRQVWQTAAQTFIIMSCALAESGLPLQELDIFGSITRCSLACNQIGPMLDSIDLSRPLEKLKSLSLSLSHHTAEDPKGKVIKSLAAGKRHANDIGRLLKLCRQLESLELHWYNLPGTNLSNEARTEERCFFTYIVHVAPFSQLRHCRLEGIYTDETTLLTFLKKATQLSSLSMEEIHLQTGQFGPVFNYLTSHARSLDHLHLDDLWESRRLICFDSPREPHFPCSAAYGPDTLTRIGGDCRCTIGYRLMQGRSLGFPQGLKWYRRKTLLYGPPDR